MVIENEYISAAKVQNEGFPNRGHDRNGNKMVHSPESSRVRGCTVQCLVVRARDINSDSKKNQFIGPWQTTPPNRVATILYYNTTGTQSSMPQSQACRQENTIGSHETHEEKEK